MSANICSVCSNKMVKMARHRLESSSIDVLSAEARKHDTYGNAEVWSELHHSDPYPYTTE